VRALLAELNRDGRGLVLLSVAFGWFLGLGIRLTAPALMPFIRADFGISLATTGLLLSVLWVTFSLLQLPGGMLGDRIGERNVLAGSALFTVVALAASAVAWSPAALLVAFVLLGVSTGVYATTRFTSLTDIYPERAATVTGICSAAGNVGTILLPAGAAVLAGVATWRAGFGAAIPLFVVASAGLWATVPYRTSGDGSAVDDLSIDAVRRIVGGIATPRTLVYTAAMFLMSFVYQGFTSFYPTYLVTVKDISEGTAALMYSVFFAVGVLVQPLGGAAADALGDRRTLSGFSLLSALSFVLLVSVGGFWPLVAVSMLLSVQLAFWPIAQAAVIGALPDEMQGTGFGFLRTVYLLLAAAAPLVVGTMGDGGLFDAAFLLLAGCALGAAALVLALLNE
jgi:predicted MFS family arabinose efflux permease